MVEILAIYSFLRWLACWWRNAWLHPSQCGKQFNNRFALNAKQPYQPTLTGVRNAGRRYAFRPTHSPVLIAGGRWRRVANTAHPVAPRLENDNFQEINDERERFILRHGCGYRNCPCPILIPGQDLLLLRFRLQTDVHP